MHNLDLILTLAGALGAALALGYLTHRMGLSPIVGYLLAGIAVGPFTPGFVADREMAEQLAEIGVVLLMFGVGLQFHINELWAVRRVALPGAFVQSLVATLLGAAVMHIFGWSWTAGLVFGLAISVASTVVLTRVLSDSRDLHTPTGHVAIGWLVVEDLFTVLVLVLMPALLGSNISGAGDVAWALLLALLKISLLVACIFVIGGRVIPWVLERIAAAHSRELFTLTVLVLALGISVGSAKLFDVSMALGAFLAGMVVGRSDFSLRAASEALPMRDAFAVLFFVSVGMLLDPRSFLETPGLIAVTLAIIMIGKPLAAWSIVLLLGYPSRTALGVAAALAQIGEFSFILANLGRDLGVLTGVATNTLIAAAIISITVNPLIYTMVGPVDVWLSRRPRLRLWMQKRSQKAVAATEGSDSATELLRLQHTAVVVGFGPVGQTVARLLRQNQIEPTIIELNLDTIRRLRAEGFDAVYGDVRHRDTLGSAGIQTARSLVLSSAGMEGSAEIIRLARELNPDIQILARANYVRELPKLREAGADDVFSGEGEVALAVTETILRELGATPEQIDRERDRVQTELFGEFVRSGQPQSTNVGSPGNAALSPAPHSPITPNESRPAATPPAAAHESPSPDAPRDRKPTEGAVP